jgi:hypothetical protein
VALLISGGFSLAMALVSEPTRPWVMGLGVAVVALQSVPFGLAVGAAVPRELEGTLVLIGVVGIQLATRIDTVVSQILPFYGPRRLVEASLSHQGAIGRPLFQTFFYGIALLIAARLFVSRRVDVARHDVLTEGSKPRRGNGHTKWIRGEAGGVGAVAAERAAGRRAHRRRS